MTEGAHRAATPPPSQHPTPPGEVSFVIAAGLSPAPPLPEEEQTASHVFPREGGCRRQGAAECGRALWWVGTQGEDAMAPELEQDPFPPWARTSLGTRPVGCRGQVRASVAPAGSERENGGPSLPGRNPRRGWSQAGQ